jgi:putative addiction module component (TIGR02574 family)
MREPPSARGGVGAEPAVARIGISADVWGVIVMRNGSGAAPELLLERMTMTNAFPELLKLSVAERIQLVEDIWDSIAAEPNAVPLSDELREELDHRLADQAANPGVGKPWSEVKARLLGSR